jgi:N-acetylneuraminic acid mutarotase
MPTARTRPAAAVYNNKIYIIGGETAEGVTDTVERYDPATNLWVAVARKPTPVVDAQAAVIGGLIYVPGGRLATGQITEEMEVYDPRSDRWHTAARLPKPLSAYAMAAFEGRLYVFGGWDGENNSDSVYEYIPTENAWLSRAPMPMPRVQSKATVAAGKIHVLGGENSAGPVLANDVYIPEAERGAQPAWESYAPLPDGRSGIAVVSVADMVYVVGGVKSGERAAASFQYSPQLNEWQSLEAPPTVEPWADFALVATDAYLYAIGGKLDKAPTNRMLSYQVLFVVRLPVVK